MKPIRILIIDDHTLFRSGVSLLLKRQAGFEVVGEAGDSLEGVKRAKQLKPDVVLLDLHMPGTSGLEAIPLLKDEAPEYVNSF
jgi:two-component system, NarL family, nitrate/nitrite response regulator NarL